MSLTQGLRRKTIPWRKILPGVLQKVEKLPYKVTLRFVFYRVLQAVGLEKASYDTFKQILAYYRKNFIAGWEPDTLTDDTTNIDDSNIGQFHDEKDVYNTLKNPKITLNKYQNQKKIIIICFEARAMYSQFEYYCRPYHVILFPFGGDAKIEPKWRLASMILKFWHTYHKPTQILYFGDADSKGKQIPENAMKDVKIWIKVQALHQKMKKEGKNEEGVTLEEIEKPQFEWMWCGLTIEQATKKYKLPKNPDKPKQYQWEALEDEDAAEIITNALNEYVDLDAIKEIEELEKRIQTKWREQVKEIHYE